MTKKTPGPINNQVTIGIAAVTETTQRITIIPEPSLLAYLKDNGARSGNVQVSVTNGQIRITSPAAVLPAGEKGELYAIEDFAHEVPDVTTGVMCISFETTGLKPVQCLRLTGARSRLKLNGSITVQLPSDCVEVYH